MVCVYPVESENSDGALKACKGKGNQKNVSQVKASPGGSGGKVSTCNAGDPGSVPGLGRFPWRREWQPTLVFLAGESHGQRSL